MQRGGKVFPCGYDYYKIIKKYFFFMQQIALFKRLIYEVIQMTCQLTFCDEQNAVSRLVLDTDEQAVYMDDQACPLTQQEFSLLQVLSLNANKPMTRAQLLRDAWGYICPGETRTVDVHVQRLRKKLGFSCIETVYRQGYRLRASVC